MDFLLHTCHPECILRGLGKIDDYHQTIHNKMNERDGTVHKRTLFFIGVVLLWISGVSAADISPVQTRSNLPANFHTLAGPQEIVAMPQTLLDSNPDAVRLLFTDPPVVIGDETLEGVAYSSIRMNGEGSTIEPGAPDVPRVTRLIMVGHTGQIEASVADQSYRIETLSHQPIPYQMLDGGEAERATGRRNDIYTRSEWYPSNVVEVSPPFTLRDVRFVILIVHPVQVNPVTGEMRIYDRLEVAVNNIGGVGENEIHITPTSITPGFKKLYSSFENFRGSALDELPVVPGKQLYICADDATIINEVQKLIDWRRKKGVDAAYVTLTTIGGNDATLIRNYISNQYTASNGELEFVTLVGDADGVAPYALATVSTYLDNGYGALTGGPNPDPVPDIAIGRLPVESASQLAAMVSKTIRYESDPLVTDTTWFTRAWCAAHTAHVPSNSSTKEYTRQIMLQHGMREVPFNVYSGGMSTSDLETRLNEGVCVFNDRLSYVGEFYSSYLDGLSNGRMQPFVAVITCGTGTFWSGDALSEEFVRRGTTASPVGAIGCVGLSGVSTLVPYNNILDAGMMYGFFVQGIREQGLAVIAGKLQLYKNYWEYGLTTEVNNFSYWLNLMGDPAVPIWLSVPRTATVTHDASVNLNTNNIGVTVQQGGSPLEGALVGLMKGTETFSRGYTNAAGTVNLPVSLPTTGYLYVTVTREGLDTYMDSILVRTVGSSLSLYNVSVDDDNTGGTVGDANAILNPGETVDLSIRLTNTGTSSTATGISGTLTSLSPGVQVITGTQSYPNITVGGNAAPNSPFRIQVGAVFDGEPVTLMLNVTSSAGTQVVRVDLTPAAGDVAYMSSAFLDGNSRLDPGETGNLTVTFNNNGSRSLVNAQGVLRSLDDHVVVNDSLGSFGTVGINSDATNNSNTYNVSASGLTVGGYQATMQLVITDDNGFRDSTDFILVVGIATSITPTGPDAYGYYAYDNTETQPSGCASGYDWVEICPALGGSGTSLGFTDGAEDDDDVTALELPFDFQFYGETFDSITICSNGWLAFGTQTRHIDFRDYHIGSPLGPINMIAGYWDDLKVTGIANGGVFTWYDLANSRYIVEWRTQTLWTSVDEVFQIILWDPNAYPSPTGDGKILVQYETCTPSQNHGYNDNDYATVGIQNSDHSIGLEYTHWNVYPASAAVLESGRSIMFTTDVTGYPHTQLALLSPNGGEVWYLHNTASIFWAVGEGTTNVRLELSRNGTGGPWETLAASTPNDGFYSFTITGATTENARVRITDVDNAGTQDVSYFDFTISSLKVLAPNGGEIWYRDSTAAISWIGGDPSALMLIELSRHGMNGPWEVLSSAEINTGSFAWTVAGAYSDSCRARVTSLSDPVDSDVSDDNFKIHAIQAILNESFEDGASGWTHNTPGTPWIDDWHISTERARSGSYSYKCGDTDAADYSNYCDSRLESPVIPDLPASTTLQFVYQIESELSSLYPDSAYDGGLLEIAVDGGGFSELAPVGGYPRVFRWARNSAGDPVTGPLPGRPCFGGIVTTWTTVTVDLSAYEGHSIQLRWRFGSDAGTAREGWYIDDIAVFAPAVIAPPTIPLNVTISIEGSNVHLRWADDDNVEYKVYSSTSANGPFDTLVETTTENDLLIEGAAGSARLFYMVVGSDGN